MDNLNRNPLLDDDEDETVTTASKISYDNPLLDDDEEVTVKDSGLSLPDIDFDDYTPSGHVRVPPMVDHSDDDGRDLFIDDRDSLPNGFESYSDFEKPEESYENLGDSLNGVIDNEYVHIDVDAIDSTSTDYENDDSEDEGLDEDDLNDTFDSITSLLDQRLKTATVETTSLNNSTFDYLDGDDDDEDELFGFNLDQVISTAIENNASDIHVSADDEIAFSILGEITRMSEFGVVMPNVTQKLQLDIISHVLENDFVQDLELDTSYVVKTGKHAGRRLRLSVGKSFGNIFLVFRVIADRVPTPAELGVTGSLLDWCTLPNGLVMMNGPTGTGKSTTLASLVKQIQLTRRQKIITIEKPIEFVFGTEGLALVTQREVGKDSRSFAGALTSAMRQAPNIIVVGEVRDRVEVNELLRAAETGHLTISTMHTNSAPATINRIKSLYEGEDQARILGSLADVSRGFANQVLVKTPDGKGRFAIREVLDVNEEVAKMILRGDVSGIQDYQMGEKITMDHELVRAVSGKFCTVKDARLQSANPNRFDRILKDFG